LIRDKMQESVDPAIPFIKVVDFGMSKHVKFETTNSVLGTSFSLCVNIFLLDLFTHTHTHTHTQHTGTPGYQAPEVMRGKEYTAAVDCFSLGALTYIFTLWVYASIYQRGHGRPNSCVSRL